MCISYSFMVHYMDFIFTDNYFVKYFRFSDYAKFSVCRFMFYCLYYIALDLYTDYTVLGFYCTDYPKKY